MITVAALSALFALLALFLIVSTSYGFKAERDLLGYDAEWDEAQKKSREAAAPRPSNTHEKDRHTENDPSL